MTDPASVLLKARAVRACYENVEVLHGIDLTIATGSVTAILGPNGAGKSTLLAVLAGLHPVTAGLVRYDGGPVRHGRGDALVQAGLCLIPEGKGVFPNLTVAENLWMMTHGGSSRRAIEEAAYRYFPQLATRRSQAAGTLSGGEQQMLAMARAVSTTPRLLLLDELSMGLAPIIVEDLYAVVRQLAADGVAEFALQVAQTAAVMTGGRIVHVGPTDEVATRLHDLYFSVPSGNGHRPTGPAGTAQTA
jgi:branched-chain amino acid transport system ATP-binding protein